jgi:peptidoglycan hydrolase-like protein with peptidoglycan-binding domain
MGPERGWADIGYSFGVCPHGKVMEGRGVGHVQAAQPGGNATWYSVTFMSGPGEKPTAAQTGAFRALRSWLRVSHGVRAAVTYHGKFTSTDCPGSILKRMVLNGSLLAGDPSTKPPKPKPTGKAPAWPGVYLTQPPAKEQKGARTWQQQMAKRGWRISVDGVYGPESEKVCRSFQRQAGLLEDGIVGPIVWRRSWSEPIR